MIRYLFAAAALLAFIGAVWHPEASAQFTPGVCVAELVTTTTAGVTHTVFNCENRTKFTGTTFTGGPCTAPTSGVTLYATLADGSCLPVQAIAAPGFVADNIQLMVEPDGTDLFPNSQVTTARIQACAKMGPGMCAPLLATK